MRLTEQLTPSLIKIGLESEEKEELFEEMVQLLVDAGRITDRDAALQALFEREAKMTTGIARWIGLPHGKVEGIDGLILALGISDKGIEYDSLDEEPVHIVLLVLADANNPGPHIEALAEISRLFSAPGFTESMRNAKTAADVLELIRAEEQPKAMDDLLQRMLTVEKEADELVHQADVEAAELEKQARGEVAEFVRQFRAETATLAEKLIADEATKAEESKRQALAEADEALAGTLATFEQAVAPRVPEVTRALAFPSPAANG